MKLPESTASWRLAGSSGVQPGAQACVGRSCSRWRDRRTAPAASGLRSEADEPRPGFGSHAGPPPRASRSATAGPVRPTSPSTPRSTGRRRPRAAGSSSTCTSAVPGPRSRPCRVVQLVRLQPQATTRSASVISSAASGVAKPPQIPRSYASSANVPAATAEVVSSAPTRSASAAISGPYASAPRPARKTGRSASAQQVGQSIGDPRVRRRSGCRPATARAAGGDLGGLDVERQVEHDRAATVEGRPVGPLMSASAEPGLCTRSGTAPTLRTRRVLVDPEVRADGGAGDVGRQHQQRGPALGRLGDAGHRVGQTAALVHAQHADRPLVRA